MHHWNSSEIKALRLRLGWSAAHFSRRLNVPPHVVIAWESGMDIPSSVDILQLEKLEFYLESYSQQLQRDPFAEKVLRDFRLDQIGVEDLNKINKEI